MGVLLIAAAIVMVTRLQFPPSGGEALGLRGPLLAVGLAANFMLGAIMTLGIGLYAPCMILISLLGMNEKTAYPIMMGSCAFLMPAASVQFVRSGRYDLRASLGLALGGAPAALLAGLLIKELQPPRHQVDRRLRRHLHRGRDVALGRKGEAPWLIRCSRRNRSSACAPRPNTAAA